MNDLQKAGKYEILTRIGEGGFGVVYKGRDPFIKRTVAIKTCTTENEGTRRRFLREAEIAGNIVHPNITVVYDFGFEGEIPYLVQEFLSGEDLDVKITRNEPIPLRTKLDYLLQTAQGLGFAHEKGITHRDIKPSNLRVLEDGRIKIMDFGIAKLASGETQLTQTGTTLGTPAYLSPEQLRGDEVDARSDIYSFGALAYELLTRRRMFDAKTISALFFQILHQEPVALTQCLDDCPTELDTLIAGCVAKDPDQRLQSFVDIIVGLRRVIDQLPTQESADESAAEPSDVPQLSEKGSRERDRQTAIGEARNEIEELLSTGAHSDAASALAVARERFGDLVPFRTLHERLVQARAALEVEGVEESAELLAAVEDVRRLTHEGRLMEADGALTQARLAFPEGPSLIAAGRQLRVQNKIREAREALAGEQLEAAEAAAQRAQELDPDAPELAELLRSIERAAKPPALEQQPVQPPPASDAEDQAEEVHDEPVHEDRTVVVETGQRARTTDQATAASETPTTAIPIPRPPEAVVADSTAPEVPTPEPTPAAPVAARPALQPLKATPSREPWTEEPAVQTSEPMLPHPRQLPLLAWVGAAIVLLIVGVLGVRRLTTPTEATGRLSLDALPWAEVVSLTNEDGSELAGELSNGARLFTPLSLALPPGTYRVTLARPDSQQQRSFEIAVAVDASAAQRLELQPIDIVDYFERVGLIEGEKPE